MTVVMVGDKGDVKIIIMMLIVVALIMKMLIMLIFNVDDGSERINSMLGKNEAKREEEEIGSWEWHFTFYRSRTRCKTTIYHPPN